MKEIIETNSKIIYIYCRIHIARLLACLDRKLLFLIHLACAANQFLHQHQNVAIPAGMALSTNRRNYNFKHEQKHRTLSYGTQYSALYPTPVSLPRIMLEIGHRRY
jgi:hypothetical protein